MGSRTRVLIWFFLVAFCLGVPIAAAEEVTSVVKSKSMTTEAIHLNSALEAEGIAVRETDLGEYIVQLGNDRPSHIVAPIIHMGLQEVREVFRTGLMSPIGCLASRTRYRRTRCHHRANRSESSRN